MAASQHQGARLDSRVSTSRRGARQPRLSIKARGSTAASQHQGARVETRASVVTVLVMGPVTAHVAGKLTPYCGVFLGGTYAPETSINSLVAMKKGSDLFLGKKEKEEEERKRTHRRGHREKESPTLQLTCCVQVSLCRQSL